MVDNYREIQPLNGREIVHYSKEESIKQEKKRNMKNLLLLSMMTGQGELLSSTMRFREINPS